MPKPEISLRPTSFAALLALALTAASCGGGAKPRDVQHGPEKPAAGSGAPTRPAGQAPARAGPPPVELFVQTPLSSGASVTEYAKDGFLAADEGGTVYLFDAMSRRLVRKFAAGGPVVGLSLRYDCKIVYVSVEGSRTFQAFDLASGTAVQTFGPLPAAAGPLGATGDSRTVLVGCADGMVRMWNVDDNTEWNSAWVSSAAITRMTSATNWKVGTIDANGVGRILDFNGRPGRVQATLAPAGKLRSIAIRRYERGLLALTADGSNAHVWKPDEARPGMDNLGNRTQVTPPPVAILQSPSIVPDACFSGDGKAVVVPAMTRLVVVPLDGSSGFEVQPGFNPESLVPAAGDAVGVVSSNGDVALLDIGHRCVSAFPHTAFNVQDVALSADARLASVAAGAQEVRAFDLGELRGSWTLPTKGAGNMWRTAFAPDGSVAVCADLDGALRIVDGASGRTLHAGTHRGGYARSAFSPDGKALAIVFQDFGKNGRSSQIEVERCAAGAWEPRAAVPLEDADGCAPPAISADLRFVAAGLAGNGKDDAARKGAARVWDAATGKVLATLKVDGSGWVSAVAFTPDGKSLLASAGTAGAGGVKRFAVGSWKEEAALARPAGAPIPDRKLVSDWDFLAPVAAGPGVVAQGDRDGRIVVWPEGKPPRVLEGHRGNVLALALSADGRYLLSGSGDGTARLWRLDDPAAAPSVSLVAAEEEWIIFGEDGTFDASRRGGTFVNATMGLSTHGVDQLAMRLNRPDRLLERMGLGSAELRASLKARAERRMQRAGTTAAQLEGPVRAPHTAIIIANRTQPGRAVLTTYFKGGASYQVYVNDVPLFGLRGKPLRQEEEQVTEQFAIAAGPNKIEVSCTDAAGMESLRAVTELDDERQVVGDLYVLALGVSAYAKPGLALRYAHQDALDLAETLKRCEGKGFGKVHAKVLTDAAVTKQAIGEAKAFLAAAKADDTAVLFVAGHGVHDATPEATYYYLTADADPANLAATAAPFEMIEELLHATGARRKLFLMDTCESGELEPGERGAAYAAAESRGIAARGFAKELASSKPAGTPARTFLRARDRYIDNDLARRSGAIVFSSSRGGELSYESEKIGNGFFTEAILDALTTGAADANRDGKVTTDELRAYVSAAVGKATGDAQHPTVDRDNISARFAFPVLK